ncbi:hypothetical protein NGRA_0617 [Nosema granulosis]|uniref:Uncharacterized protein n=1 Tax=Nosema granulosis TaxID=83296 RepID=A0A9P6L0D5_9MICR|nr:hypothetical protein NGRA_0617 [Nosema granulosis]
MRLINWRQIYDFWALAIESLVCLYLYHGNKKKITLEIIKNIEYPRLVLCTSQTVLFCLISIAFMLLIYVTNPRILIFLNGIMSLIICSFLIENRLVGCASFLFVSFFSFPLFLYRKTELLKAYKLSLEYLLVVKRMMPLFFVYSAAKTIGSVIMFQVLVSMNFSGHRYCLFIFMNVIFILAMTKKVMAEVVLLFIHKNNEIGILDAIFGRILCIGTIALSSLIRPLYLLMQFNKGEEYAMIYAIVHRETYFDSIKIVEAIEKEHKHEGPRVYIRRILYPFVFCSMFFAYKYIHSPSAFFGNYEFLTLIFYLHAITIETLYTFQSTISFVLKTTSRKEIIEDLPVEIIDK